MIKYEIMLVINGELEQEKTLAIVSPLASFFNKNKDFTEKITWSDQLAYAINKKTLGHRFLWNFESNDVKSINEFNRLVLLNKEVLRHLVINLEKDYAYKTKTNPKKMKSAEIRQKKYQDYLVAKALNAENYANKEILPEGSLKRTRVYNSDRNAQTGRTWTRKYEYKKPNDSTEEVSVKNNDSTSNEE